jgi:hypothetical protein
MEKLKLEIIKKVMMLDTLKEVKNMRENICDAISRECELEDKNEQEYEKWKANQLNV